MANRPPKPCANVRCGATASGRYCESCARENTRVVLVIGPSGSGKSTYVRENAKPGDLIVDFDDIFAVLSGMPIYQKPAALTPFILAARDAVLALVGQVDDVETAWVIRNKITRGEVRAFMEDAGAEVVHLREGPEECKRRIRADPERPPEQINEWCQRIDQWYREHPR